MVEEAVLAVAGPVLGDEVRFSNSAWRFSIEDVRRRLGLRKLIVINDLVAQALSFAALQPALSGMLRFFSGIRPRARLGGANSDMRHGQLRTAKSHDPRLPPAG
jgi:hypothetical protein